MSEFENSFINSKGRGSREVASNFNFEERSSFLKNMIRERLQKNDLEKIKNDPNSASHKTYMRRIDALAKTKLYEQEVVDKVVSKEELDKEMNLLTVTINAQHILIKSSNDDNKEKAKIDSIYSLCVNSGSKFSELAKQFSEDEGTAKLGGDLGWFGRGKMVQSFEDIAFSLKEGEISKPVKTKFGYHIIQVSGIRKANDLSTLTQKTEEAKKAILRRKAAEAQEISRNYLKSLRDKYNVTFDTTIADRFIVAMDSLRKDENVKTKYEDYVMGFPEYLKGKAVLNYDGTIVRVSDLVQRIAMTNPPARVGIDTYDGIVEFAQGPIIQPMLNKVIEESGLAKRQDIVEAADSEIMPQLITEYEENIVKENFIAPSDEEVEKYYNDHKDEFTTNGELKDFSLAKSKIIHKMSKTRKEKILEDWRSKFLNENNVVIDNKLLERAFYTAVDNMR
ncbi:MAG: peptidylprolyl isomerase [Candidatus Delongbacteria bacterium]|nr:peptidylprolyl isomerase [Candidatus Delongbacteria bacterium]MBN2835191.1 peptidylprolyl isomerase [Candidatus Delongbacteria bacterium]